MYGHTGSGFNVNSAPTCSLEQRRRSRDLHTLGHRTHFQHHVQSRRLARAKLNSLAHIFANETLFTTLSNPYPQGMLLPPGRSRGDSTYIGLGVGTPVPTLNRNPEYYSWNYSLQRQIGSGVV